MLRKSRLSGFSFIQGFVSVNFRRDLRLCEDCELRYSALNLAYWTLKYSCELSKRKEEIMTKVWETVAYVCLALTIAGQVLTASNVLFAQWVWLVSNALFVARDFALDRPRADKVKDVAMLALTIGMVAILTV